MPRNETVPVRHRHIQRSGPLAKLPLTVLCLDNDESILDGMRALLGRWGIDCRVAVDVAQARDELARGAIDLILADYHLADDVDGLQALQQLRDSASSMPPAVIITADGSSELQQCARALGYPILHKPVKPAALRALLAAPLRGQP